MGVRFNIAEKPWKVILKRNGMEITAVYWAENKAALRERLEAELSGGIEIVSIKER